MVLIATRVGARMGDACLMRPPRLLAVSKVRPKPLLERVWTCVCATGTFSILPACSAAFNVATFSGLGLVARSLLRSVGHAVRAVFYRHVLLFIRHLGGTKMTLYGDLPGDENSVFLSNHQSDVDWLPIVSALRPAGCDGRCDFMVKNTLKFVPIFGWFWWYSGFVYVRRSWATDEPRIKQKLSKLADSHMKYSLTIFPEGTRYTLDKVQASLDFARSRGLPEMQHVLTPRSKGFIAAVQALGTSLESVYDTTIAYTSSTGQYVRPEPPSLFAMIGQEYNHVHIHVRRFRASDLPSDARELDAWLRKRFEEKDELLRRFHRGYGFEGPRYELDEPGGLLSRQAVISAVCVSLLFGTALGRRVLKYELLFSGVVLTLTGIILL